MLHPRCAGLDVQKKTVVACVLVPGADGAPRKYVQTFGSMTADLLALGDWLDGHGVTHAAMESTGVLWKPLYNLLEERFTLLLVNAQQVKAVPGRKTDVKDSEWLADLARGKLRAKRPPLERALVGRFGAHQRFLVAEPLAHIDYLDETLARLSAEVAERVGPVEDASERLDALPGIGRRCSWRRSGQT